MKNIYSYLMFDGNCREAMTFYQDCLGGELHMMPYSEAPGGTPAEAKDRVMHARLMTGPAMLMASDTMPGVPGRSGTTFQQGDNFSVSLDCGSVAEAQKVFVALSHGGKVEMALQDTFWGAHFGMLTDRYGVNWMVSFDKTGQA